MSMCLKIELLGGNVREILFDTLKAKTIHFQTIPSNFCVFIIFRVKILFENAKISNNFVIFTTFMGIFHKCWTNRATCRETIVARIGINTTKES